MEGNDDMRGIAMQRKLIWLLIIVGLFSVAPVSGAMVFEKDSLQTSAGVLNVTFIGHGTLMLQFDGKVMHVDPVAKYADYATMPKADIIFLTHTWRSS